jgi:predicted TIM-barrel fold metal-dependent hydrolase
MINKNRKVIDAHLHIGTWGTQILFNREVTPLGPSSEKNYILGQEHHTYKDIINYFKKYGIEAGLVVCNYLAMNPKYSLIDLNFIVLEAIEKKENIYGGPFVSPIPSDEEYTLEALKLASNPKFKVIKMTATHWKDFTPDPNSWSSTVRRIMEKILTVAKDNNLILQFHSGGLNSEPIYFDNFLKSYGKDFKVYLVHSGESCYPGMQFTTLFREWHDKGYNIYSDTSLVPGFVLQGIIRQIKPDEVKFLLFATDSPWGSFLSEFYKVEDITTTDEIKDKILYYNAKELYKI